jgi:hypothetical protein
MARRTFLAQLAGLPFFLRTAKPEEPTKPLKIMMKSAWGRRRSDQSRISFLARTAPFGSRTRSPDLLVGRSDLADAKGYRQCDSARWLAASQRKLEKLVAGHIQVFA